MLWPCGYPAISSKFWASVIGTWGVFLVHVYIYILIAVYEIFSGKIIILVHVSQFESSILFKLSDLYVLCFIFVEHLSKSIELEAVFFVFL